MLAEEPLPRHASPRQAWCQGESIAAALPRRSAVWLCRLCLTGSAQSGFAAAPPDVAVKALPFRIGFKNLCGYRQNSPAKLGAQPLGIKYISADGAKPPHRTSGGIAAIQTLNALGKAEPYRTAERRSRNSAFPCVE